MGDPKRRRRKAESPKKPWDPTLLESELRLLGEYGLKNRRELRTHASLLRRIRKVARSTFALSDRERVKATEQFLSKMRSMGLIREGGSIDDVLKLSLEDLLRRRLQTIVFRKGMARSIYEARQLITHGHILVDGRVIRKPGKLLEAGEEGLVAFNPKSSLAVSREVVSG
jgi:small subunit ribosomal protein S4